VRVVAIGGRFSGLGSGTILGEVEVEAPLEPGDLVTLPGTRRFVVFELIDEVELANRTQFVTVLDAWPRTG
jgi:hypothetical protein